LKIFKNVEMHMKPSPARAQKQLYSYLFSV
jgi:hypothetical protein